MQPEACGIDCVDLQNALDPTTAQVQFMPWLHAPISSSEVLSEVAEVSEV